MSTNADGARPAAGSVSAATVAPLLVAWQTTREAIGTVQCSTPDKMSAAMAQLLAAQQGMDIAVQNLIAAGFRR